MTDDGSRADALRLRGVTADMISINGTGKQRVETVNKVDYMGDQNLLV